MTDFVQRHQVRALVEISSMGIKEIPQGNDVSRMELPMRCEDIFWMDQWCRWAYFNNKAMVVFGGRHGKPIRVFIQQREQRQLAMALATESSILVEVLDGDGS